MYIKTQAGMIVMDNYLAHVGKGHDDNPPGRGSGRYPWGSGKEPFQGEPRLNRRVHKVANSARLQRKDTKDAKKVLEKNLHDADSRVAVYNRAAMKSEQRKRPGEAADMAKKAQIWMERSKAISQQLGDISSGRVKAGEDFIVKRSGMVIPIIIPGMGVTFIGTRKKEIKYF